MKILDFDNIFEEFGKFYGKVLEIVFIEWFPVEKQQRMEVRLKSSVSVTLFAIRTPPPN